MAQGKQSLDAAALPVAPDSLKVTAQPVAAEAVKPKPAWQGPKLNYGLSAGTSFNSRFGMSNYIEPSVRYHLDDRFRVRAGLTYMYVSAHDVPVYTSEGTTMLHRNNASSHYIMSAGVDYLASDRLILSGNIWRDFSNIPSANLTNSFYNPGRMGADFRATYKITENFTVTGGIRYTDGNSGFGNGFYGPGYGGYQTSPFGY